MKDEAREIHNVTRRDLRRKLTNGWIIVQIHSTDNFSYFSKYFPSLTPLRSGYYILYKDDKVLSFYKNTGLDMDLYDSLIGLSLSLNGDMMDIESIHLNSVEGLEEYIDEVLHDKEENPE